MSTNSTSELVFAPAFYMPGTDRSSAGLMSCSELQCLPQGVVFTEVPAVAAPEDDDRVAGPTSPDASGLSAAGSCASDQPEGRASVANWSRATVATLPLPTRTFPQ